MTDKEVMQMALEGIEWLRLHLARDHNCLHMDSTSSGIPSWLNKTEATLRTALAQPEPEPVAWLYRSDDGTFTQVVLQTPEDDYWVPLYTDPPQREWQGLTDEEIEQLIHRFSRYELVRAIEAKLKEKNSG